MQNLKNDLSKKITDLIIKKVDKKENKKLRLQKKYIEKLIKTVLENN